jgi:hypothetical protein
MVSRVRNDPGYRARVPDICGHWLANPVGIAGERNRVPPGRKMLYDRGWSGEVIWLDERRPGEPREGPLSDTLANPQARPLFDPLSPELIDDPYPVYHRLRAEDPVHPIAGWQGSCRGSTGVSPVAPLAAPARVLDF